MIVSTLTKNIVGVAEAAQCGEHANLGFRPDLWLGGPSLRRPRTADAGGGNRRRKRRSEHQRDS